MASTPLGLGYGRNQVFFYGDSLTQGGRNNVIASLATPVDAPSYAAVTSTRLEQTFDLSKILIPSTKGDKLAIKIPLKAIEKGKVKLIPMGKGFVLFKMDNEADFNRVQLGGPWSIAGKPIRFKLWTLNFCTETYKHTSTPVWVRFLGLPLEYWEVETLMAMGSGLGGPIRVDKNSVERDNYFCASVLVDIDLSKPRRRVKRRVRRRAREAEYSRDTPTVEAEHGDDVHTMEVIPVQTEENCLGHSDQSREPTTQFSNAIVQFDPDESAAVQERRS
ncbi:hypothetical protein IFM89_039984 [Coptis chinensis]|uniref:DUF4283 domain-containing protein n=1 Tax=Coptis chinensis TaxID=261450 RepID=A0A835GVV4_9MAGN|nr:hypothetical protein IFM89_039984 [Coptis chinensis]